ncbi:DsbA family oxidoreductase [Granulosicoccus sp. 3-233]|uniref:DsbA family oxidoreductase n=1 Tax=Granulosicoccus sp. 3-233 TaxID=3417969 RepID=UPI003D3273A1
MKIDIVSDVVCPWCIVGYRQLQQALEQTGIEADIHWHPFELNPDMPPEGEQLRDHVMRKYGSSAEDSDRNRQQLVAIGAELGIEFNFSEESHIRNTHDAHQLMHWAETKGLKNELKQSLFLAYFTEELDVSNHQVLIDRAESVGLDREEAAAVLEDQRYAETVRENERLWVSRGIQGVPAVILEEKYLLSGAQGVENFSAALKQVEAESA